MTSRELREKYLQFFEKKGHKIIPSAPLVPENDPSTLFVSAGMQPLVPYLLGQSHPAGTRLVNVQKCIRTGDIDEVGDSFHHTFFEMLGNWSLGDYFKQESIPWSYEFLTKELNISPNRIKVSVFAGDDDAPRDEEAAQIWKSLDIPEDRILYLGKEDNWWAAGATGPCGPDTEIFVDDIEVWNNVFMVYNRKEDGTLEELPKKNVDTGMGLERTIAVLNGLDDNYKTDLFLSIIKKLETVMDLSYQDHQKAFRVIVDHIRAATFAVAEGVFPDKEGREYVVRKLVRRAYDAVPGIHDSTDETTTTTSSRNWKVLESTIEETISLYSPISGYEYIGSQRDQITSTIKHEVDTYASSISATTTTLSGEKSISGVEAFKLHSTHGLSPEQLRARGYTFNQEQYDVEFKKHRELSRTASAGMFRGGLATMGETETKYHTATHLLQAALQRVLGDHVKQMGSNITAERLRFDFSHPQAMTEEEIRQTEKQINRIIDDNLPVTREMKNKDEALAEGALAFFKEKYTDEVSVYLIGDFSKEICGGPHVAHTGEIGRVTITKEESAGAGIRRIYATLRDK